MRRALPWLLVAGIASGCAARASVRPEREGETVFEYRGDAQGVVLSGSMTGWKPVPLQRTGRRFELALRLRSGRYEYRLEVRDAAGVRVVFPEETERTDDQFGGENAVLRVP